MIGIFETKKAENNKLILKSLIFGDKTTRRIAEYIYHNRTEKPKLKDNIENEVRGIVSIISRKKSRLEELEHKAYISREHNLWRLTSKGLGVALTQFNNVLEIFPYVKTDFDINGFERAFYQTRIGKVVRKDNPSFNLRKILNVGKSPEFLQFWKDYTNELMALGVDLDRMSEGEYKRLVANKSLEHFFKRELAEIDRLSKKVDKFMENEGVSHE